MPSQIRQEKAVLRRRMRATREALPAETVTEHSKRIAAAVRALPMYAQAATLAAYCAIGGEVDPSSLVAEALQRGVRVVLPRTIPAERRIALHSVGRLEGLLSGPFGILEPPASWPEIAPAEVDLFLVPGVAFDSAGHRLGYGAGYYDRLLPASTGLRVGLCHTGQLMPLLPTDAHDALMDLLVTEQGVVHITQGCTDRLRLRNMTFHGHHGAYPEERAAGIRFSVDVDLFLDLQTPGLTDDLTCTVDYPAIYRLIADIQSSRSFTLLEALAEALARAILAAHPAVNAITIAVRKFDPPVGGPMDTFEVEITRTQPEWLRAPHRMEDTHDPSTSPDPRHR